MKKYKLDKEEQELLDAVERGEFVSVKNLAQAKKDAAASARYTIHLLQKKKNINVRIAEEDLSKLKYKAAEEGLPYQTLIGSILHKYVNQK